MRAFFSVFLFLISLTFLHAQTIEYRVSFENRVHHEALISMIVSNAPTKPLIVQMSRSSAGRYAIHQFAKNVYDVKAFDAQDKPLPVERSSVDTWTVPRHQGTVRLTYRLFGDHADGTYSAIDMTHAHLNIPSSFIWAQGMEKYPIKVYFKIPEGSNWKVATQLKSEADGSFSAPDRYYFMDSPVEIADLKFREWQVNSAGKTQQIRLALHHNGTDKEADEYTEMLKKIVAEQISIYGSLPDFDNGIYTFLACYVPHAQGDGMEHRNSTVITSSDPLSSTAIENLSTASHEFFHAWNVERIRPKNLEPFDFSRENMSGELWFAEGFTTYYGYLVLARAGYYSEEELAGILGFFVNKTIQAPGRSYHSPVEMSRQAAFADAAVFIDQTNFDNTYLSYYTYGAALGLALDLSLRSRFKDISLDTYMRSVWERYGKAEKPYTLEDLQNTLAEVSKDKKFADEFFRKHIYGSELPDFKKLLAEAGWELQKSNPGSVSLGSQRLSFHEKQLVVGSYALAGSPLYEAGIDKDDIITKINGKAITNGEEFNAIMGKIKTGDKIKIDFIQRGMPRTAEIKAQEDKNLKIELSGDAQKQKNQKIKKFRDAWLGSKA